MLAIIVKIMWVVAGLATYGFCMHLLGYLAGKGERIRNERGEPPTISRGTSINDELGETVVTDWVETFSENGHSRTYITKSMVNRAPLHIKAK